MVQGAFNFLEENGYIRYELKNGRPMLSPNNKTIQSPCGFWPTSKLKDILNNNGSKVSKQTIV